MKKVISIVATGVFAIVLLTNTNNVTNSEGLDLASLSTLNQADAECNLPYGIYPNGVCSWDNNCWAGGVSWQQNCSTSF